MQMPDMGGTEVFTRLQTIDPDVCVLISSGYEESTVTGDSALSDRLAGFVKKPYTIKGLETAIDKALHHQRGGWDETEREIPGVDV
jgi:DNA-binding NtrC family response regulator